MYHAACKVEVQPFKRSYSQLTFFNFLWDMDTRVYIASPFTARAAVVYSSIY